MRQSDVRQMTEQLVVNVLPPEFVKEYWRELLLSEPGLTAKQREDREQDLLLKLNAKEGLLNNMTDYLTTSCFDALLALVYKANHDVKRQFAYPQKVYGFKDLLLNILIVSCDKHGVLYVSHRPRVQAVRGEKPILVISPAAGQEMEMSLNFYADFSLQISKLEEVKILSTGKRQRFGFHLPPAHIIGPARKIVEKMLARWLAKRELRKWLPTSKPQFVV